MISKAIANMSSMGCEPTALDYEQRVKELELECAELVAKRNADLGELLTNKQQIATAIEKRLAPKPSMTESEQIMAAIKLSLAATDQKTTKAPEALEKHKRKLDAEFDAEAAAVLQAPLTLANRLRSATKRACGDGFMSIEVFMRLWDLETARHDALVAALLERQDGLMAALLERR